MENDMAMWNRVRALGIGAAVASLIATGAAAQAYPEKPIRMIAPFPPGGIVDTLARAVGAELGQALGQPVVVENRPGAGGNIGADVVAKAEPDGYTLLMTSPGIQSINQFLYKAMPFDPDKAFAPISTVADMPMVVVVHPKVGVKTLKELIAHARANPGKLNFGTAGIGTTGHLGQAYFTHVAKIDITPVHYRGAAPAVKDLIAGQLDGVVDNPPNVIAHIQAGTILPLAVGAKERLPLLPKVPTSGEAGLPDWQASSWFGVVAPAGTPPAIIKKLHAEIAAAVKRPAMQRFTESGMRLVGDSPEKFSRFIVAERKKWGEIVKAAKIPAQ
jgi:tripartite-type tricarboxylate transporter receptor subunit TctC